MKILKCKICGFEATSLTSHLKHKHKMSGNEYKKIYNVDKIQIVSENTRKKLSENSKKMWNDVEFRKRYKNKSIYTIEYWIEKGYTKNEAKIEISKIQSKNSKKKLKKYSTQEIKEMSSFSPEYWIKQGFSKNEADNMIKNNNKKYTKLSRKFSGKNHSFESKDKISKTMKYHIFNNGVDNWLDHFGDISIKSKGEVEVFDFIKYILKYDASANVNVGNKNVDILYNNKIIEYFGDFWHCNPKYYKKDDIHKILGDVSSIWEKDKSKINYLTSLKYDILIIWEDEWKNDSINTKQKITEFLNENS